jgi:hypothetical protein
MGFDPHLSVFRSSVTCMEESQQEQGALQFR